MAALIRLPTTPVRFRRIKSLFGDVGDACSIITARNSSSRATSAVPRILLLGAPGSGKGTYAVRIAKSLNVPVISAGDIVRAELASDSVEAVLLRQTVESGGLVPDTLVTKVIVSRLAASCAPLGYVLEGFPRTVAQAQSLDASESPPTVIVLLELPSPVIVQKIAGRRICASCGAGYNVTAVIDPAAGINMPAMPPHRDGVCDRCGGELRSRADDAPAVVERRLQVYEQQSAPVVQHYMGRPGFARFGVAGGVSGLLGPLLALVRELGARTSV
jgi:adenylate kinase